MQNVRRRLLHREIGNALEKTEDAEELTEELADHFVAAEERDKAVKYLRYQAKKHWKNTLIARQEDGLRLSET